jgi:hypothetical protein
VYGELTDIVVMRGTVHSPPARTEARTFWIAAQSCTPLVQDLGNCIALCCMLTRCSMRHTTPDKMTGNGRGFGFVTFQDMKGARHRPFYH